MGLLPGARPRGPAPGRRGGPPLGGEVGEQQTLVVPPLHPLPGLGLGVQHALGVEPHGLGRGTGAGLLFVFGVPRGVADETLEAAVLGVGGAPPHAAGGGGFVVAGVGAGEGGGMEHGRGRRRGKGMVLGDVV